MEGQDRTPGADYPDEEYLYYVCAKEFGWTPTELDEQPAALIDWIVSIHNIVRQVEHDQQQYQSG